MYYDNDLFAKNPVDLPKKSNRYIDLTYVEYFFRKYITPRSRIPIRSQNVLLEKIKNLNTDQNIKMHEIIINFLEGQDANLQLEQLRDAIYDKMVNSENHIDHLVGYMLLICQCLSNKTEKNFDILMEIIKMLLKVILKKENRNEELLDQIKSIVFGISNENPRGLDEIIQRQRDEMINDSLSMSRIRSSYNPLLCESNTDSQFFRNENNIRPMQFTENYTERDQMSFNNNPHTQPSQNQMYDNESPPNDANDIISQNERIRMENQGEEEIRSKVCRTETRNRNIDSSPDDYDPDDKDKDPDYVVDKEETPDKYYETQKNIRLRAKKNRNKKIADQKSEETPPESPDSSVEKNLKDKNLEPLCNKFDPKTSKVGLEKQVEETENANETNNETQPISESQIPLDKPGIFDTNTNENEVNGESRNSELQNQIELNKKKIFDMPKEIERDESEESKKKKKMKKKKKEKKRVKKVIVKKRDKT